MQRAVALMADCGIAICEIVHDAVMVYEGVVRTERAVSVPCGIMVGIASVRPANADVKTDFWRFHCGLLRCNTAQEQVSTDLSCRLSK